MTATATVAADWVQASDLRNGDRVWSHLRRQWRTVNIVSGRASGRLVIFWTHGNASDLHPDDALRVQTPRPAA